MALAIGLDGARDVSALVDGVREEQAAVGHDVHDHHGADDAEHDPGVPAVGEALQLRDEPEVHEGHDARDDPEDHDVLEQVVAVAEGAEQGVGALRVEDEEVEALVEAAAHEDDRAEQQRREAREDEVVRDWGDGEPLPDAIEPVFGLSLPKQDEAPEGAHGKQPNKPSDQEGHRDGVHVRRPLREDPVPHAYAAVFRLRKMGSIAR
ncbi:MAG: hypothetical protein IPN17_09485 [Deltaproteobacteria bacterium]|nr:hypothetical protein [Deltaproteobacteria bacterium]